MANYSNKPFNWKKRVMAPPIQSAKGMVYNTNSMQEIVVDIEVARVKIKIFKDKKAEIIMFRLE